MKPDEKHFSLDISLTLEQALYVGLFTAAALLRFWNLGSAPLDTAESDAALRSWSIYHGLPATTEGAQLATYLNLLVFLVFGDNDASARVLSAVAGSVLVLLPYYGRYLLGRDSALIAAVLFAFSPTMIFFSRRAGDTMLIAVLSLAVVITFVRWAAAKRSVANGSVCCQMSRPDAADKANAFLQTISLGGSELFFYANAILLGLLLANSIAAYWNILILGIYLLALTLTRWHIYRENWLATQRWGRAARWWVAALAVSSVTAITGGLSNLHGVQEQLSIFSFDHQVIRQIGLGGSPISLLLLYEPLIVAFAIVGGMRFDSRKTTLPLLLIWWAIAWLAIPPSIGTDPRISVVQALVPLTLLAAGAISRSIAWFVKELPLSGLALLATAALPPSLLLFFILSRFSLPGESIPWTFAIVVVAVLLLALAGSLYWKGASYASRLWSVFALVILLGVMIHTTTNLSYRQETNPAEPFLRTAVTPDVRNLAADIDWIISRTPTPLKGDIVIENDANAVLKWYLRKYNSAISTALQSNHKPLVVLGGANSALPSGKWAMQRYTIRASSPDVSDLGQLVRWLIYREISHPTRYETVTMYVAL